MSKGINAPWTRLAYLLPALVLAACGGDDPQVPTTITAPSGTSLTGTVGLAVSVVPTVSIKDQKGKPLPGIWVRWTPSAGKAGNDSSQTDAAGSASALSWTLGTTLGPQSLSATAGGLGAVTFTADAKAGPVRVLTQLTATQTAAVGSTLAIAPSVRASDQYGNPVANVAVLFAVATGAGSITGATQTTNASGLASVGSWKLGTLAGPQTLRVDATDNGTFTTLTAIATSAPAFEMVLIDPGAGTGSTGKRLCTSPVIAIRDVYGNGVGQVPVTFVPANGSSGTVSGTGTVTTANNNGYATIAAWTLGATGTQTLVATSSALPGKQLTFTATLVPAPGYSICARFLGDGGTARQRQAISSAVAKWQRVITGHVNSDHLTAPANQCQAGIPAIDEDLEDLLLFVQLASIDGPRNIIGQAAPCYIYQGNLTAMGFLQLDVADLDLMLADGTLDNVVLHEIGHILGIGTLWNYRRTLLVGPVSGGGLDPYFAGASARDQFALLQSPYLGTPVPVENCVGITGCGAGTRDSHWRKSVFNTELMQGYSNPNMPLSKVTVGSLADLGYKVNLEAADSFTLAPALRDGAASEPVGREMINDIADRPMWRIERNGTNTLIRAPVNPLNPLNLIKR